MARPDFRGTAARRLAEERELSPGHPQPALARGQRRAPTGIRNIPLDRIDANPDQPRMTFDEDAARRAGRLDHASTASSSPSSSGRPTDSSATSSIAGERRWRAAQAAGLREIPALIEEIDDETALEIAIIENLQREDLSPLDEAMMYDRMTTSMATASASWPRSWARTRATSRTGCAWPTRPTEIKQLVSLRKDTLSHAYELLKVEDPKKRRRLAEQVARGELSLVKLREKIDGRPASSASRRPEGRRRGSGRRCRRRGAGAWLRPGGQVWPSAMTRYRRQGNAGGRS